MLYKFFFIVFSFLFLACSDPDNSVSSVRSRGRLYRVSHEESSGGSVRFERNSFRKGEEVVFFVLADEGYCLSDVSVVTESGKAVSLSEIDGLRGCFRMQDENVTVYSFFKRKD